LVDGKFQKTLERQRMNDIVPIEPMDIVPEVPTNLPRWALENYEGAEKDFSQWMLGVQYQSLSSNGTKESVKQRMAQALANSLKATFNLQEVVERSKILQLWNAQKTGFYHLLPQKYETVAIFLKDLVSEDNSESENSNLSFLLEYLLPACEYLNISVENVICIPAYLSKARRSVPALRDAWKAMDAKYRSKLSISKNKSSGDWNWKCGGLGSSGFPSKEKALDDYQKNIYTILTEEDRFEFSEMIYRVIELIPREDISVSKFETEMNKIRGKVKEEEELASSMLILLPGNKEILLVQSPSASITKRIEHQLKNLTSGPPSVRDPTYLVAEISDWLSYSIEKGTYSFDIERNGFVKSVTGFILLTPGGMLDQLKKELSKAMPIIEQVFKRGLTSWSVPIYSMVTVGSQGSKVICDRFDMRFKNEEDELKFALDTLPDALINMYSQVFEQAVHDILPLNFSAELGVGVDPDDIKWGVYVTVTKTA